MACQLVMLSESGHQHDFLAESIDEKQMTSPPLVPLSTEWRGGYRGRGRNRRSGCRKMRMHSYELPDTKGSLSKRN